MANYPTQYSAVAVFEKKESYEKQIDNEVTVDSTNTLGARIHTFIQRAGENIVDVAGQIFDSSASPVTFDKMEYSKVGDTGPWLDPTILTSDDAYVFPSQGDADGEPFNIPIEIAENPETSNIWFRIEVSF